MKDKHKASEEDIAETLIKMRESNVNTKISIWNDISSTWTVDSVSQVHISLYRSGHIKEMVEYILESRDVQMEDTAS